MRRRPRLASTARRHVVRRRVGRSPSNGSTRLQSISLVVGDARSAAARTGVERDGHGPAAWLARDLANTPPSHLTARKIAERAVEVGDERRRSEVEVFNRDQLTAMGCGGIVGVNAGSTEPPRVIR